MTEERLLDSDDFEEEAPKKRENSTIRQLREAQEAAAKERDEFRERATKYEDLFLKQSGLAEAQAKALRASGYEATPEGIDAFRKEVLGVTEEAPPSEPDEAAEDEGEEEVPVATLHQPTPTGAGEPKGSKGYTSNELLELMQSDPAKADKVLRSGKVVRKEFNPGGPRF
jgi:hypothetical protein